MPLPKPQKFTPPAPGEKVQDWREIWGPQNDFVAPGYDPSKHPIQTESVTWLHSPDQLKQTEQ